MAFLRVHGATINTKDKVVQTFSAKVSALGTSTNGRAPSIPASLACKDCAGALTATASVPWLVITSVANGSIAFNVFSNTSTAARTGTIDVASATNKVTLTVEEAGSTAPLASRQAAYLYQRVLGREPDAMPAGPVDIGRLATDLIARAEVTETGFQTMAMHQAVDGSLPDYPTWLAAVERLRNGTPGELSTSGDFQKQEHEGKAWRTLLYYLLLERAPTEAELVGATSIAALTQGAEFLGKFQ
jgi:hypothetical protein